MCAESVSLYAPSGRSLYASERRSRLVGSWPSSTQVIVPVLGFTPDFQAWWVTKEATVSPAAFAYTVLSVWTLRRVPVRGWRTVGAPEASEREMMFWLGLGAPLRSASLTRGLYPSCWPVAPL